MSGFRFFFVFRIFFSKSPLAGQRDPKKESQEKGAEPCRLPETGVVQLSSFRPGGCLPFNIFPRLGPREMINKSWKNFP